MSRRPHRSRRLRRWNSPLGLACCLFVAVPAAAEPAETAEPQPDKSGYSLFDPVPDSRMRDFAPDRPAKTTGPTTVDAGHVQYELDFASYNFQSSDGIHSRSWVAPNPTIKIGLTNSLDLQLNMAPYTGVSVSDSRTRTSSTVEGVGDLVVRAKWNLGGNEGGKTAFAIIPFIKVPTAPNGIGNGATEGGALASLQVSLPKGLSLVLNSEVDALKDSLPDGHHTRYVNAAALTVPVVKDVSFTTEIWSSVDRDPAGTVVQASIDAAFAWTVRPNLQLDVGANFGLNAATPRFELYGGLAQRF